MFRSALVIALLGLFCFLQLASAGDPKIVGGTTATRGQFPWMCRLKLPDAEGNVGLCGASIINGGYYVLTAAHCFNDFNPATTSVFGISCEGGINNDTAVLDATYQIRYAVWYKIHPLWNQSNSEFHYDIAIIRVHYPFILGTNVSPIPLATSYPSSGSTVYASGWGATSAGGDQSTLLLWTDLPYLPLSTCQNVFDNGLISGVQICAGGVVGQDTCQGDSGGPLFATSNITHPHDAKLIGLTSFGIGCGGDTPGVYTDIPSFGSKWVDSIIHSTQCRRQCILQFFRCKAATVNNRQCRVQKNECFQYCGKVTTPVV